MDIDTISQWAGGIFMFIFSRKDRCYMDVQRKPTIADTELEFSLSLQGLCYLVKNFTEDDIYIGFVAGEGKTTRALVPAETAQIFEGQMIAGSIMYVLPAATSEKGVEVQCLRW